MAQQGDTQDAIAHLQTALRRVGEAPDVYVWLEAYILDALCEWGPPERVPEWSAALTELAAHTGMREWSVHACLRRAAGGDSRPLQTARIFLGAVENPSLHERVEGFALAPV